MAEHYTLNPFSFVTETDSTIMLNTTSRLRAHFAKEHRPIVDLLIDRGSISHDEIVRYLAPTRLDELVAKRILLPGEVPPVAGRYSRQLGFLAMLSADHQRLQARLRSAHVLLLGAGAVGSHVLWNLAAIGVGKLTVVDFDVVEETNLNRQLMYAPEDIGRLKADVLCAKIAAFNPTIDVVPVILRIASAEDIAALLPDVDLVVKAIDTPEQSTTWLNQTCVDAAVPYVTGGFLDYVGVVGPIYVPGKSLCAACYGYRGEVKRLHGTGPTFAPLTTIVSSMVAMTAFKILVGDTDGVVDRIHSYDTIQGMWTTEQMVATRPCDICGATPVAAPSPRLSHHAKKMWAYRAAILAILGVSIVIRDGFGAPVVGVLTLFAVMLSVPMLWLLCGGDSTAARRELFVTACTYIGFSGLDVALGKASTMSLAMPHSFEEGFAVVQSMSIAVLEVSIAVTILFFILSGVLWFTQYTTRLAS